MSPVPPGVTVIAVEPVTPVADAFARAALVTGCTAMGMRTTVEPLVQVSEPLVQVSEPLVNVSGGAVVRVKVTVYDYAWPAALKVSVAGETVVFIPAIP